jgi:hypothetical protein
MRRNVTVFVSSSTGQPNGSEVDNVQSGTIQSWNAAEIDTRHGAPRCCANNPTSGHSVSDDVMVTLLTLIDCKQ